MSGLSAADLVAFGNRDVSVQLYACQVDCSMIRSHSDVSVSVLVFSLASLPVNDELRNALLKHGYERISCQKGVQEVYMNGKLEPGEPVWFRDPQSWAKVVYLPRAFQGNYSKVKQQINDEAGHVFVFCPWRGHEYNAPKEWVKVRSRLFVAEPYWLSHGKLFNIEQSWQLFVKRAKHPTAIERCSDYVLETWTSRTGSPKGLEVPTFYILNGIPDAEWKMVRDMITTQGSPRIRIAESPERFLRDLPHFSGGRNSGGTDAFSSFLFDYDDERQLVPVHTFIGDEDIFIAPGVKELKRYAWERLMHDLKLFFSVKPGSWTMQKPLIWVPRSNTEVLEQLRSQKNYVGPARQALTTQQSRLVGTLFSVSIGDFIALERRIIIPVKDELFVLGTMPEISQIDMHDPRVVWTPCRNDLTDKRYVSDEVPTKFNPCEIDNGAHGVYLTWFWGHRRRMRDCENKDAHKFTTVIGRGTTLERLSAARESDESYFVETGFEKSLYNDPTHVCIGQMEHQGMTFGIWLKASPHWSYDDAASAIRFHDGIPAAEVSKLADDPNVRRILVRDHQIKHVDPILRHKFHDSFQSSPSGYEKGTLLLCRGSPIVFGMPSEVMLHGFCLGDFDREELLNVLDNNSVKYVMVVPCAHELVHLIARRQDLVYIGTSTRNEHRPELKQLYRFVRLAKHLQCYKVLEDGGYIYNDTELAVSPGACPEEVRANLDILLSGGRDPKSVKVVCPDDASEAVKKVLETRGFRTCDGDLNTYRYKFPLGISCRKYVFEVEDPEMIADKFDQMEIRDLEIKDLDVPTSTNFTVTAKDSYWEVRIDAKIEQKSFLHLLDWCKNCVDREVLLIAPREGLLALYNTHWLAELDSAGFRFCSVHMDLVFRKSCIGNVIGDKVPVRILVHNMPECQKWIHYYIREVWIGPRATEDRVREFLGCVERYNVGPVRLNVANTVDEGIVQALAEFGFKRGPVSESLRPTHSTFRCRSWVHYFRLKNRHGDCGPNPLVAGLDNVLPHPSNPRIVYIRARATRNELGDFADRVQEASGINDPVVAYTNKTRAFPGTVDFQDRMLESCGLRKQEGVFERPRWIADIGVPSSQEVTKWVQADIWERQEIKEPNGLIRKRESEEEEEADDLGREQSGDEEKKSKRGRVSSGVEYFLTDSTGKCLFVVDAETRKLGGYHGLFTKNFLPTGIVFSEERLSCPLSTSDVKVKVQLPGILWTGLDTGPHGTRNLYYNNDRFDTGQFVLLSAPEILQQPTKNFQDPETCIKVARSLPLM